MPLGKVSVIVGECCNLSHEKKSILKIEEELKADVYGCILFIDITQTSCSGCSEALQHQLDVELQSLMLSFKGFYFQSVL